MAEPTATDPTLLQAAFTALSAGAIAVCGWLWTRISGMETRLDQRISDGVNSVKTAATADIRDIWTAITEDRRIAAASRERLLERLGDMPTKADLRELKTDLQKILERDH